MYLIHQPQFYDYIFRDDATLKQRYAVKVLPHLSAERSSGFHCSFSPLLYHPCQPKQLSAWKKSNTSSLILLISNSHDAITGPEDGSDFLNWYGHFPCWWFNLSLPVGEVFEFVQAGWVRIRLTDRVAFDEDEVVDVR